ncbi:hypothetical protein LDHU3_32.3250:CDS1 [Leishmania donovani]|uniref:Hypothetical_protein n=2 Tax=Leishmania donovani species complex TaxID=38574 RepID=A0A6L0XXS7_LEIIN|nr:hypothetical protein LdCL_320031700 [Leishmania donovani]CAC9526399.1 hypothetical_protein [Leishmania infantum]CAJ1991793.1 hypothetical protein LDHU3_32.3250:CDS1 [Leishmania donovani]SUZ44829.1 hypothetical_protein [Leishmania infantum]VDZ47632.1 hypothetical_protein [Leishmania donovani]
MWRIKAAGLVSGFVITCAGYYKVFALEMLSARAAQEKRYEDIEQRLLAAARDAMKAAPAEHYVVAQATGPPS